MSAVKALYAISTNRQLTFDQKVAAFLKVGIEKLNLETAIVSNVIDNVYTIAYAVSPNPDIAAGAQFSLADTYCVKALKTSDALMYHNINEHPGADHPCYDTYPMRSYFSIPLEVNGKTYGTLNFSSAEPRHQPFSDEEIDYVYSVAGWISTTLSKHEQIAELKAQRDAIEERNVLLNQITELAGIGTWEFDIATQTFRWSRELRTMFGITTQADVPAGDIVDYIASSEEKLRLAESFDNAVKTGVYWSNEFEVRTKSGHELWIESRGQPIYEGGKCVKVIGATRDITNTVTATKSLKGKTDIAERALKARSDFLANMSHEIRTPIHGVQGMLESLSTTSLTTKQSEYTRVAMKSAESLLGVVNDILDFSKIDAGLMHYESTAIDIDEIIQQQLPMFFRMASNKGLYLESDTSALEGKRFLGDSLRINQIIMNLVNNALKFTSQGGVRISTRVKPLDNNESAVKIIVADTGIGMSKAQREVVFAPFLQAEESTQRRFGGTGLGLAIVKNIVNHYNGNITVVSEPDDGSRFVVTLILQNATAENKEVSVASLNNYAFNREQLKGRYILVVEDNEINQIVIKEQLSDMGIRCELANNGQEGVDAINRSVATRTPFDMVFMDCQMPVMDGLTAVKHIRAINHESIKDLPIVALTANALTGEKERCLSAGMNDFMSKPVSAKKLKQCILHHIASKQRPLSVFSMQSTGPAR
ncbi:ATP-binding protein [Alteromonas sp. A079]|uniref:GAF domain-containing hybrid sensor histidine kinase/response regulator n=1 Tax=Alteromonas sp. A079 TaxID=3410268 RepID=UPI003B9E13BD